MDVKSRFLKYVSCWTTSDEESSSHPSSERQFDLARILCTELQELGLQNVELDEHCYVYGCLPASEEFKGSVPMGFISHMDTAPAMTGENVKPQIIENYNGEDIYLPTCDKVIETADFPHLTGLKGKTLVTTDGSTLLGADDKAGIAEIMTALETIITKKIPHGEIWIGFTPDEEVGAGADLFDLSKFKAAFAYTVDGDYEGEVAYENFNASSAKIKITGKSVHTGDAKNIMKNAAGIACEIHSLIPSEQSPEHTYEREGFYHLDELSGDVISAQMNYILRDHDADILKQKEMYLISICNLMNQKYGSETVECVITETYRNMLEIVETVPSVISLAREAIASTGLPVISTPVRGGTDGSRLSFMGLPCPNLGTGGHAFHGPYEHIAVESMETVVDILCYISSHPLKTL